VKRILGQLDALCLYFVYFKTKDMRKNIESLGNVIITTVADLPYGRMRQLVQGHHSCWQAGLVTNL
jgi:hypothetical protein